MADANITVEVSTKDAQKRLLYLHRENARLRRRIMADAVVCDEAAANVVKLAQSLAEAKADLERHKPLLQAVEWLLDDGHMNTEHLARLRAAWEEALVPNDQGNRRA